MNFRKFESIENTYNSKNVSKIVYHRYNVGEWLVTEKLHGANFSIYIKDGKVVNFGSRNQFVDESFYDSGDLQKELREGIESSFDKSWRNFKDSEIIIYGELVGNRVQKEVYYCDDVMFYMFDMVIDGEVVDKDVARDMYFNCHEWAVCSPFVFRGTFEDCIKVNNTFNSLVSRKTIDNEAEGIIIEPVIPMFYDNGKRILLKNKTRQFSEKNDGVIKIISTELSEKDNDIFNELMSYLNINRLNAVKSKGHPEKAVPFMLVKDIVEDYNKDSGNVLREYADDQKSLMRRFQLEINKFMENI